MANERLYYAGFLGIVVLGLTYVFLGADIIPDSVAVLGPGALLAYFDDAMVVIAGWFALAKWRQVTLGSKIGTTKKKGLGWQGAIVFIPIVAAGILYVFWGVDLIPDQVPYVGWFDDAAAIMLMFYTLGKVRKRLRG